MSDVYTALDSCYQCLKERMLLGLSDYLRSLLVKRFPHHPVGVQSSFSILSGCFASCIVSVKYPHNWFAHGHETDSPHAQLVLLL